jgi:hypothetical protein
VKTLALLILLALSSSAIADDDKVEFQKMTFVERGDLLTVSSAALTKLFDNAAYDALDDGPASTVVIRIAIIPQGGSTPVSGTLSQRQVSYEPWDEVFYLNFDCPGQGCRKLKEKRKADALKRITAIENLPVAFLKSLPYDQIFVLVMQVELNPVSQETLAEVRRWLSQGNGGGLDRGGAFFGSFVSVFVNPKIPAADRVMKLQSQPFFRPRP